jgi:acyl-CoA thioester hydrolase
MSEKVFFYQTTILEHHLDAFCHVNNASYLQLFEEARWDFSEKIGHGLEWVLAQKKGPIVLNVEISFRKELVNREKISIESWSLGMKNRLVLAFEQKMRKENGQLASAIKLDLGFMDLKLRKLSPFPQKWMESFGIQSLETGAL